MVIFHRFLLVYQRVILLQVRPATCSMVCLPKRCSPGSWAIHRWTWTARWTASMGWWTLGTSRLVGGTRKHQQRCWRWWVFLSFFLLRWLKQSLFDVHFWDVVAVVHEKSVRSMAHFHVLQSCNILLDIPNVLGACWFSPLTLLIVC